MNSEKRMVSFCRELRRRVYSYLQDKEHRKEFEQWYLDRDGKPYEWKKRAETTGSE